MAVLHRHAARRNDPVAGVLWVTLSMALMAVMAALGRHATNSGMHPFQLIFCRCFFALLAMLPLLAWRGRELARSDQIHLYGVRVAFSLVSMMAWFSALALIPIGELTAISFMAPLFGTLGAVLFLGEVVRMRRLTALAVGFLGAMIILRPGSSSLGPGQLLAVAAAATSGLISILIKQLTHGDDPDKIVFLTSALLTPMSLVPALFVWRWDVMSPLLPFMILLGAVAVLAHITLVRGFAATDASLVLTFEFSRLPFAALVAWWAFGERLDVWTWIGAAVIVASATYITRREAMLKAGRR